MHTCAKMCRILQRGIYRLKLNIDLWKCSVVFFVLVLLYGAWFLYKKTVTQLIILLILLTVSCVFYTYCNKRITLPEGYTVIQARRFYRSCLKAGLNSRRKLDDNEDILQEIVKKYDFAANLTSDALWKLYCDGRAADNLPK